MSGKRAATWHGVRCDGTCCPRPYGTGPRNPLGVCGHGHQCTYHRPELARAARQDEADAQIEPDRERTFYLSTVTRGRRRGTR